MQLKQRRHITCSMVSSSTSLRSKHHRYGRTDGGHCRDDKAAAAARLRVHRAQLRVLPHDAGVLLVQAHRLLDLKGLPCMGMRVLLPEVYLCKLSQPYINVS